jgi:hypothetical protein
VVDVTVRYENKDSLFKAEKGKIDKYLRCLQYLKRKFNVGESLALPVVLCSRGTTTPNTEANLKLMGVPKKVIKTIIMNILRISIEMCNIFMDG